MLNFHVNKQSTDTTGELSMEKLIIAESCFSTGTTCRARRAEPFANVCIRDFTCCRGNQAPLTTVCGLLVVSIQHFFFSLCFIPFLFFFSFSFLSCICSTLELEKHRDGRIDRRVMQSLLIVLTFAMRLIALSQSSFFFFNWRTAG